MLTATTAALANRYFVVGAVHVHAGKGVVCVLLWIGPSLASELRVAQSLLCLYSLVEHTCISRPLLLFFFFFSVFVAQLEDHLIEASLLRVVVPNASHGAKKKNKLINGRDCKNLVRYLDVCQ